MLLQNKSYYQNLHEHKDLSGFKWNGFCYGIHLFTKLVEGSSWKKWAIECTEEDIENNNIEYMCKNGWTTSKDEIKKVQRKYKKKVGI